MPLFAEAFTHAKAIISRKENSTQHTPTDTPNKVFFHLEFPPKDLKPSEMHHLWQEYVSESDGRGPLREMFNIAHETVNLYCLTIPTISH